MARAQPQPGPRAGQDAGLPSCSDDGCLVAVFAVTARDQATVAGCIVRAGEPISIEQPARAACPCEPRACAPDWISTLMPCDNRSLLNAAPERPEHGAEATSLG